MKKIIRWSLTMSAILIWMATQLFPVQASSSRPELALTPSEQYVRDQLLATGKADLKVKFPNSPAQWVIRGAFIQELWTNDPEIAKLTSFEIDNAVVDGNIEANGINLPFSVELQGCIFYGEINLAGSETKTFRIDASHVVNAVKFGHMTVNGDMALYGSTFDGEVTLFGTDISKNLFARGSTFNGVIPDKDSAFPFELWTTHVGQTTELTNSTFKGEVKVDNGKFDGDLNFDGTTFEKPASFASVTVGNVANFQDAVFKNTVTFKSSIMERDAEFTGATFNGAANFDYIAVTRFFDFDQTTLNNSFSIQYSTIGWPYFADSQFHGQVDFEGLQASNDLDFTGATYDYLTQPFKIELAKVDGRVLFKDFSAKSGLDLADNQFGALTITGKDGGNFDELKLDSIKVGSDLDVENAHITDFSAQGLAVNGSTILVPVTVSRDINMSNSSLGVLTIEDTGFWTGKNRTFDLHGMTFSDLAFLTKTSDGFVDKEFDKTTKDLLTQMLEQSKYSPQVYQTMEQFLSEKGHPDWAADVEVARKERERDQYLDKGSAPWLWSWFLFLFSGYGQRPIYALGWSVAIILLGAWFFKEETDFNALDRGEDKPKFNPYLYSLALFITFFEFGFDKNWEPKATRTTILIYKQIHRLLGWIVAPIALLAFSGIIK